MVQQRAIYIGAKPFRSEGMPFGISHSKSQIPDMKSEICDLKFRVSADTGSTSIDTLSFVFLVVIIRSRKAAPCENQ